MLNHVSVGTNDLERAGKFYDATLGALGYKRIETYDFGCAWGVKYPVFWAQYAYDKKPSTAGNGSHFAFIAASRDDVDKFHATALANGATDNGPPGERDYEPDYYAAFVIDLDGNKLEAVHMPMVPFPEV